MIVAAAVKHRKGAKVTCRRLMLHAVVLDTHVSHRVRRLDGSGAEIVIGEGEREPDGGVSAPLETYTSHLIENHWDGAHHWVADHELEPGHDMAARAV